MLYASNDHPEPGGAAPERPARRGVRARFVAAAWVWAVGCSAAPAPAGDAAGAGAPTLAAVDRLIGAAACTSDADCRSVAIGAKACGGPEGYRAWSIRSTDAAAMTDAAARHAAARRAEQEKRAGLVSDCAVVGDPGARCEAGAARAGPGRCVLRPATRSGPVTN